MSRRFLDDAGKAALLDAVRTLEARSAAEVVVAVRDRSGWFLHANLLAGLAAAYVTLWFQLFSPWEFTLVSIQVAPAVVGLLVGLSASVLPDLQRWLTPAGVRRRFVETAARAAFQEKGVGLTRGRTGVLVYLSLLERAAAVVADQGVAETVAKDAWSQRVAAVDSALARGGDATAVAAAMAGLGDVLAAALPRTQDDVNELADEVGAA
jgi:putative membrane protein